MKSSKVKSNKEAISEEKFEFGSSTYTTTSEKKILENMASIEIVNTALETAKNFAKSFEGSFIPCGNKEIDDYITALADESNSETISIPDFQDQLLDYIIPGCAGSRVFWEEDENGLQYPKYCVGFDKSYIKIDQNGIIKESTSGGELDIDPYRIYMLRDILSIKNPYGKGKEKPVAELLRHIIDFYKNMSVTGKKYKNPGKIIDIKQNQDETKNKNNIKGIAASAGNLDNGSALVMNGLEKFVILPTGKVEELLNVIDGLERKLVRGIVGHQDALDSLKYGSGSKMDVVMQIVKYTAKTRNQKVCLLENQLYRNVVNVRWGETYPAPVKVYDYLDDADPEEIREWYNLGMPVRKSKVYSRIGGEPKNDDILQKEKVIEQR